MVTSWNSSSSPGETGRVRIRPDSLRFEFVGFGERAASTPYRPDRLYLDVGNDLRTGVVDHHHLAAYAGSTASLVVAHPDLVLDAVDPGRKADDPFTIVLHMDPDLDCLASAYLAISVLTAGTFPAGVEALARYIDRVDSGHISVTQDNPFTLYSAYMLVAHRLTLRTWRTREDMWREYIRQGLPLVEFATECVVREQRSILEIDAFDCPGLFGPDDRETVRRDLDRYRHKLQDPTTHATRLRLRLPGQLGGTAEIDALLARDVENPDDPGRVLFFKDWARTDRQLPANKAGFAALSVFLSRSTVGVPRCILSVRPDSGVCLRGLGALLDEAEAARRVERHGVDDRVEDPRTHQPLPRRPGYPNADPWYDGRAHGYTIIDAPRSGTLLSAEEIERLFIAFGGRGVAEVEPLRLPSPGESDETTTDAATLGELSSLVKAWQVSYGADNPREVPDIFLSYPRAKLDWVREQLYAPLREWRREARIFFDQYSLEGGVSWLARLATAVDNCRVFVPLYCEDFFRSDYCQWELQLALLRDPIGRKRIIVPVMLGPVSLPHYCALIQAVDSTREDFRGHLFQVLGEILGQSGGARP
jgi:hypothetical protein